MAVGQKLEEDLESKVRLSGWDRLRRMNGRLIEEGSEKERKEWGVRHRHRNRTEKATHPRS